MANIITGQSFSAGDQVTSVKLNNIIGSAKLDSDSITGTTLNLTNGELKVATNGITDNELNANSVTTAKIANDAVTYDKIQDVAASSVIGNTTGSTATPTNVSILDEATMASNSANALATQQSIKSYVDNQVATAVSKFTTGWFNNGTGNTLTNGQNYTFSHTLGTDDLVVELWQRDLSGGTNLQKVEVRDGQSGGGLWGATITGLTTTTITVQLAISGTLQMLSNGNGSSTINWNTQQFKLVVVG